MPDQQEPVILHVGYPIWRKHLLIAMARARELQDNGNRVVLTHCAAISGTCAVNLSGNALTCAICRSRVRQTAEANGFTAVPLSPDSIRDLSLSEKKDLAEGVRSAVISEFRQLPKDSTGNRILHSIKRRYFRTSCGLLTAMKDLVRQISPVRLEVFNGRHACSRMVITAANSASLPFNTLEVTGKGRPILFEGHTAHNRVRIQERMLRLPVDMDLAKSWFDRRRKPSANKFAKKHAVAFVPPEPGRFRRKISIFLSSQDEFEALGPDWRSPFPGYEVVVREACEKNPDDLFCIRFHPNQATMATDIRGPFADIEKLPNTVVYYPEDTANTYTLVTWSDIVVTFGSTVTAEACWVGKPAIMLGPSLYDLLGLSYNPSSMDEFLSLLRQDLAPLPPDRAAPVAMYQELDGNPMRYISHNGKTMIPNGVVLRQSILSRFARTSENLMCRLIRQYSKWTTRKKNRAA